MRLLKVRDRGRSLFFSASEVNQIVGGTNSFQIRCNELISRLPSAKGKPEKAVVDIAFRSAHKRISGQRLEWSRFLRFMGKDATGYAMIEAMTRKKFLLELLTFVEGRIAADKEAQAHGRRNSSQVQGRRNGGK